MIGMTLGWYLFRSYLFTFLQFLVGITLLAYIADFTELSRRAGSSEAFSVGTGLYLAALRVPTILQAAIPFVVLFSSISILMRLNSKYELVVARSAGVSAWGFLTPICLVSFLVGVGTVAGINPLGALALGEAEKIEVQLGIGNRTETADGPPFLRQSTPEGVTIIGAVSIAENGALLGQPSFLQLDDDNKIISRIDAASARLVEGDWVLSEAIRVGAATNAEKLGEFRIATNLRAEFVRETFARPESVAFFDLPEKIRIARAFGFGASGFSMQFHSLVAMPALLVAMTLIAAVVSLNFVRFGQSLSVILGGIISGFMLYVVSVLIKAFGNAGIVPPMVAAWLPVLVAMALGITILLHKEDG